VLEEVNSAVLPFFLVKVAIARVHQLIELHSLPVQSEHIGKLITTVCKSNNSLGSEGGTADNLKPTKIKERK